MYFLQGNLSLSVPVGIAERVPFSGVTHVIVSKPSIRSPLRISTRNAPVTFVPTVSAIRRSV